MGPAAPPPLEQHPGLHASLSLSLDHGKTPALAGSSWSTPAAGSETPTPLSHPCRWAPQSPALSRSLCLLTRPPLLSGRRGLPVEGPAVESSRILGPPEPSLPARPHVPLQQQSRGQHQGPKVRGPAGLPGFAAGAWPTVGWAQSVSGELGGLDWRSDKGERGRRLLVGMEDVVVLSMVDTAVEVLGLGQVGEGPSLREKRSTPRPACRSGTECSLPGPFPHSPV